MIDSETLLSMDGCWARLGLEPDRATILTGEASQLAAAVEAVRLSVRFDSEPADFRRIISVETGRVGL